MDNVGIFLEEGQEQGVRPSLKCSAKKKPNAEGEVDTENKLPANQPPLKHKESLKLCEPRVTTVAEEGNLKCRPSPNSFCTLKF